MQTINRQKAALVRMLTVSDEVAGRMVAAGLVSVKRARQATVAQLTAIQGIDTAKANEIRGGSL